MAEESFPLVRVVIQRVSLKNNLYTISTLLRGQKTTEQKGVLHKLTKTFYTIRVIDTLHQEPIIRSMQRHYINVTAFL